MLEAYIYLNGRRELFDHFLSLSCTVYCIMNGLKLKYVENLIHLLYICIAYIGSKDYLESINKAHNDNAQIFASKPSFFVVYSSPMH